MEFSIFESSTEWDFDIEGRPAYSFRAKKTFETDEHEHTLTASYTRIDNRHVKGPLSTGLENKQERISLGVISESTFTEDLLTWGEIVHFNNHPLYRSPSRFLYSTGAVIQIADRTFLSGEYNTMRKHHESYATALWHRPISEQGLQLSVGLEYRYTNYYLMEDDYSVGLLFRIQRYRAKGFRF